MEETVEDGTELLELRYFLKDHIGSVLVIAEGGSQVLLQEFHYDVWGKREFTKSNDNPYVGAPEWDGFGLSGRQGFTGHEMLDNVGLIHMNGRVYDPELGRFVSADPKIPDPYNSQAFNRYAYVYNNPLSFTDPDGFDPEVEGTHGLDIDDVESTSLSPTLDAVDNVGYVSDGNICAPSDNDSLVNNQNNLNDSDGEGWFSQIGVITSTGSIISAGVDTGVYFGVRGDGAFEVGTFTTTSIIGSPNVGTDGGIILSQSDYPLDNLEGHTKGINLGVDTPVVDVMAGIEKFQGTSGYVKNISLTVGVEPSALGVVGTEITSNWTEINPWYSSEK